MQFYTPADYDLVADVLTPEDRALIPDDLAATTPFPADALVVARAAEYAYNLAAELRDATATTPDIIDDFDELLDRIELLTDYALSVAEAYHAETNAAGRALAYDLDVYKSDPHTGDPSRPQPHCTIGVNRATRHDSDIPQEDADIRPAGVTVRVFN